MTSRDSAEETTEVLREESQTDNHPSIMTAATARSVAARHIMRIILKLLMVSERVSLKKCIKKQNSPPTFFFYNKNLTIYHTN